MLKENDRMKKRSLGKTLRLAALAGVALLGACVGDGDELITTVPTPGAGGALFTRYVSLGNSITAGFQSGGLTDSLQVRAYPVLLAQRANTTFDAPLVTRTGCPVPMVAPLTPSSVAAACARINNPRVTGNVAVPGARIADLVRFPSGNTASLNTLLVGARTQVRAMIEAHPTFVSVWIGNNDALEATLGGILGPRSAGADSSLTQLSAFNTRLAQLVDSIKVAAPQGAMLVGVVNAIQGAPLIQPGAYFFLARDAATGRFNGKPVNANCSPVTALGQPNPLAANMVSFQIVGDGNFLEINCDPAAYPVNDPRRGAYLLDTAEQAFVAARVTAFNQAIQAAATANNWLYVDPNEILLPFLQERDTQGRYQRLRKCQALPAALASGSAAAIQAAVLTSCPVPPSGPTAPFAAPNFFGSLMSFDGVHPSTEAHRILAGSFAARINAKYGTTLSTATT
jgi:lysophospholipase L1-like esterase